MIIGGSRDEPHALRTIDIINMSSLVMMTLLKSYQLIQI